jgi:hypothetical protein
LKPKKTPRRNDTRGVASKKDLKSIDSLLQTATPRRTKLLALEEQFESKHKTRTTWVEKTQFKNIAEIQSL